MKASELKVLVRVDKGRTSEILGAMVELTSALAHLGEAQIEVAVKMTALGALLRPEGLLSVKAEPYPDHADGT